MRKKPSKAREVSSLLKRPRESLLALYVASAAAVPGVVLFTTPGGKALAVSALAWCGARFWYEGRRRKDYHRVLKASMALARYSLIITGVDGRIIFANACFTKATGLSEEAVIDADLEQLASSRYSPEEISLFWEALTQKGTWEGELWCRRKNKCPVLAGIKVESIKGRGGTPLGYAVAAYAPASNPGGLAWHSDRHDALTGLPNRQYLHEMLSARLPEFHADHGRSMCLDMATIDIDGFQMVNSGLGTKAGDDLLMAVGQRLRQSSKVDFLGRLGSDEFLVACKNEPDGHAGWVASLRDCLSAPFEVLETTVSLSVSIGSCQAPCDNIENSDGSVLLQHMEMALARAKLSGGNTDRRYLAHLDAVDVSSLRLVQLLRMAIDAGKGLYMHYQGQHDSVTGELIGLEALLRWEHGEDGLVSPADFIPLAERNGLMEDLGKWVIDEAARQISAWQKAGLSTPTVWINVSAIQFYQSSFEKALIHAVELHGIPPAALGLELTESLLIDDRANGIVKRLGSLRERGFAIAIDDFGTGHSSLGYLRDFPLDKLKLDRVFIQSLPADLTNAVIVKSVLEMADHLALEVVAEGVENAEQVKFLSGLGCRVIQGFYFSRPAPPGEWTRLMEASGSPQKVIDHDTVQGS